VFGEFGQAESPNAARSVTEWVSGEFASACEVYNPARFETKE